MQQTTSHKDDALAITANNGYVSTSTAIEVARSTGARPFRSQARPPATTRKRPTSSAKAITEVAVTGERCNWMR